MLIRRIRFAFGPNQEPAGFNRIYKTENIKNIENMVYGGMARIPLQVSIVGQLEKMFGVVILSGQVSAYKQHSVHLWSKYLDVCVYRPIKRSYQSPLSCTRVLCTFILDRKS